MGKGFDTFLRLSTAGSAADIQYNTKKIARNQEKQLKIQQQEADSQAQLIAIQLQEMKTRVIQDWLTNHPEDAELIGQCMQYCKDYQNLSTFKKLSSDVGLEFLKRQKELHQKLQSKCPHLIIAFPQLEQKFLGMKDAEKSYGMLEQRNEITTVESHTTQRAITEENLGRPNENKLSVNMLSKSDLKAHIKIQKDKIRNLKEMYRSKIQNIESRLTMAQMKAGFTFGLSSSANASVEQLTNEITQTKTERVAKLSAEELLLNEMETELRGRK